ncbi:MAG: hypothetical protein ACRDCW_11280 [Sarcina sp.]
MFKYKLITKQKDVEYTDCRAKEIMYGVELEVPVQTFIVLNS